MVQQNAYDFNQGEAGKVVEVLVEGASKRDNTLLSGKSPKNQTVHAPIPDEMRIEDLVGSFVNVHVDEARTWYLRGSIVA